MSVSAVLSESPSPPRPNSSGAASASASTSAAATNPRPSAAPTSPSGKARSERTPSPVANNNTAKRRKTARACDPCRMRKLKCVYEDGATTCMQCVRAQANCESLKPARIDKRRLRTLVERAETDSDRKWIAEQVASRGIYTASTDLGAQRKARPSAVGSTAALLAQLPLGEQVATQVAASPPAALSKPASRVASAAASPERERKRARKTSLPNSAPMSISIGSLVGATVDAPGIRRAKSDVAPSTSTATNGGSSAPTSHRGSLSGASSSASRSFSLWDPTPTPALTASPDDPDKQFHLQTPGASTSRLPEVEEEAERVRSASKPRDAEWYPEHSPVPSRSSTPPPLKTSTVEPLLMGPTSAISLLGEGFEPHVVDAHDRRFGLFRLEEGFVYNGNLPETVDSVDDGVSRRQLEIDVVDKLYGFYVREIAPLFPVIAPHRIPPPDRIAPPLLFAMLGVAALHRSVPFEIYHGVRMRFQAVIPECVMGGSTLGTLQTLLIASMSHELHGQTNMEAGSAVWNRSGLAIRQAQDIGLQRLTPRHWRRDMYADRMRAWISAVIQDRWFGLCYGKPITINLDDCEDPFADEELLATPDGSHRFHKELYKMFVLVGRVCETMFRYNAPARWTDETLYRLLADIDAYAANVPEEYAFHGQATSMQGGLLNLLQSMVEVLFFRPFVKLNPKIPEHITFRPKAPRWYATVQRARTALSWIDLHGDVLLDCWMPIKISVVYCALSQYYHFLADSDGESLRSLEGAMHLMHRWSHGPHGKAQLPFRTKVADIVKVFWKAAREAQRRRGGRGRSAGSSHHSDDAMHAGYDDSLLAGAADTQQLLHPDTLPADLELESDGRDMVDDWIQDLLRGQDEGEVV